MATKTQFAVVKNGEFQSDESATRFLGVLETAFNEFKEIGGVCPDKDGNPTPENHVAIDPDQKKRIKAISAYVLSFLQANKAESSKGRTATADHDRLERIYVDFLRANPTKKKDWVAQKVSDLYNNDVPNEDDQITGAYVTRVANAKKWNLRVEAPEEETVNA